MTRLRPSKFFEALRILTIFSWVKNERNWSIVTLDILTLPMEEIFVNSSERRELTQTVSAPRIMFAMEKFLIGSLFWGFQQQKMQQNEEIQQ